MRSKRSLVAFMLATVVLSVWFLPGLLIRVVYGDFPIGQPTKYRIVVGMTREEVLAVLGPPHERYSGTGAEETWCYRCYALNVSTYAIYFDGHGRVSDDDWYG